MYENQPQVKEKLENFSWKKVENMVLIYTVVYIIGTSEEDSIVFGILLTW